MALKSKSLRGLATHPARRAMLRPICYTRTDLIVAGLLVPVGEHARPGLRIDAVGLDAAAEEIYREGLAPEMTCEADPRIWSRMVGLYRAA